MKSKVNSWPRDNRKKKLNSSHEIIIKKLTFGHEKLIKKLAHGNEIIKKLTHCHEI